MEQKADNYPNLDTMLAYLEGRLDPAGKAAFEAQLAADEELALDLEELQLALQKPDGRASLFRHRQQVERAIKNQSQRSKTGGIRPVYFAMAASLLMLVAAGYWFSGKRTALVRRNLLYGTRFLPCEAANRTAFRMPSRPG
ncbi:MAG: hypothetical protein R3B47_08765 [Bacteroidia bacterium]